MYCYVLQQVRCAYDDFLRNTERKKRFAEPTFSPSEVLRDETVRSCLKTRLGGGGGGAEEAVEAAAVGVVDWGMRSDALTSLPEVMSRTQSSPSSSTNELPDPDANALGGLPPSTSCDASDGTAEAALPVVPCPLTAMAATADAAPDAVDTRHVDHVNGHAGEQLEHTHTTST